MTPEHQEYRRRKAEKEAQYKGKFRERWFGWWRNPPDRFAFMIAIFTAGLFAATGGLWLATYELVEDTKSSGRAWIADRHISIPEDAKDGELIKIRVLYENSGKTPAQDVEFYGVGKTIAAPNGQFVPFESYRAPKFGKNTACEDGNVTFAGTVFPVSNVAGTTVDFTTGDSSITSRVRTGNIVFALQGCFRYKTVNGWHKTLFCSVLHPELGKPMQTWQFIGCADGHDAD